MTAFMCLPLELRQKIYRYCLVVGHVFIYDERDRLRKEYEANIDYNYNYSSADQDRIKCEQPATSVLRLCRQIHAEAEPLLYQLNTLMLPAAPQSARFFERSLFNAPRRSWVRSVRLSMTIDDIDSEKRLAIVDAQWADIRQRMIKPQLHDEFDTGKYMHDLYMPLIADDIWPKKVANLLEHLKLDSLTIDLRASYCSFECSCALEKNAILAFGKGFAKGMPKLMGVLMEEEDHEGNRQMKAVTLIQRWTDRRLQDAARQVLWDEVDKKDLDMSFAW